MKIVLLDLLKAADVYEMPGTFARPISWFLPAVDREGNDLVTLMDSEGKSILECVPALTSVEVNDEGFVTINNKVFMCRVSIPFNAGFCTRKALGAI